MLPFLLVGAESIPMLVGLYEDRLVGVDFIEANVTPVTMSMGAVNADPAAVYYGASLQQTQAVRVAAEARVRALRPRGQLFVPPPGFLTGYSEVRSVLERHRAAPPSLDAIRHSAVFAGMSIRTSIEVAEKAYACIVDLYHRHENQFASIDEVRTCIRSLGFPKTREPLYREIQGWAIVVQNAMREGLRDRELRRYLILKTEVPTLLSIAKVSFTLALLGQDCVCLDARLLHRGKIKEDWRGKTELALQCYERAEDAFLEGNPNYDSKDPIGRARAQWISWEVSPVRGQAKPASHSVWLNVVREQKPMRAAEESSIRTKPGYDSLDKLIGGKSSSTYVQPSPTPEPEPERRELTSIEQAATFFLSGVETGDTTNWTEYAYDPRMQEIVSALEKIGVRRVTDMLGAGSFGTAFALDHAFEGHEPPLVLKITSDPTETQAGAILTGKKLPHVVDIYGAWFVKGITVDASLGWIEEKDEDIRKKVKVGILVMERLEPFEGGGKTNIHKVVREVKEKEHLFPHQLLTLSYAKQREKLRHGSEVMEKSLREFADQNFLGSRAALGAADALHELREIGIYAIDVHGNNIGTTESPMGVNMVYKVFDVGTSSSPQKPKAKIVKPKKAAEAYEDAALAYVETTQVPEVCAHSHPPTVPSTPCASEAGAEERAKVARWEGFSFKQWTAKEEAAQRKALIAHQKMNAAIRDNDELSAIRHRGDIARFEGEAEYYHQQAARAKKVELFGGHDAPLLGPPRKMSPESVQRMHRQLRPGATEASAGPQEWRIRNVEDNEVVWKGKSEDAALHALDDMGVDTENDETFGGFAVEWRPVTEKECTWRPYGVEAGERTGASESSVADLPVVERDTKAVKAGRRMPALNNARAVYDYVLVHTEKLSQEVVLVCPIDIRRKPLSPKPFVVAMGQRSEVAVDEADALRPVGDTNAAGVIFCHNHPSGDAHPSKRDGSLTDQLKTSLKTAYPSVAFIDHVVIGHGEFYSFAEEKLYKVK